MLQLGWEAGSGVGVARMWTLPKVGISGQLLAELSTVTTSSVFSTFQTRSSRGAVEALSAGSELDHIPAINRLGMMYYYGLGVPKDTKKARELWEPGSRLGNMFSRRNLALIYLSGSQGLVMAPYGLWLFVTVLLMIPGIALRSPTSDLQRE
jgi:TPR repeat protein